MKKVSKEGGRFWGGAWSKRVVAFFSHFPQRFLMVTPECLHRAGYALLLPKL